MYDKIKQMFDNAVTKLMLKNPMLGLIIKRLRVEYDPNMPFPAGVDGRRIILGNAFANYKTSVAVGILCHEAMHIIRRDSSRQVKLAERMAKDGFMPQQIIQLYNIVADAKINSALINENIELPEDGVRPYHLSTYVTDEELTKLSVEEIVERIVKKSPKSVVEIISIGEKHKSNDILNGNNTCGRQDEEEQEKQEQKQKTGSGEKQEAGRKIINEGETGDLDDEKELEKKIKEIIADALATAKIAGREPGALMRELEVLLKPKIPWRRLLRSALIKGVGDEVKKTWSRQNRKNDMLPAKETLALGRVWTLIDVSGSIGEEELRQFLTEVWSIARMHNRKVTAVFWDADIREIREIRGINDIRKEVPGGGGTLLSPALDYVIKNSRHGDITVILSDWWIGDPKKAGEKLIQLQQKLGKNKVIMVSTGEKPPTDGVFIKIKL